MKNKPEKQICPSILSADFSDIKEALNIVREGGAQMVHIDVMDGHFVPNLTIGPPVIKNIRNQTDLVLDVHLMIANPDQTLDDYIKAGADIITVHVESTNHLHRLITKITDAGCKSGVALNPATPLESIEEILPFVDMVLIMSVNPGFGGQKFIDSSLEKIKKLSKIIHDSNFNISIEVDGGVNLKNIAILSQAGVNIAVAGAAIFKSENPVETIKKLSHIIENMG